MTNGITNVPVEVAAQAIGVPGLNYIEVPADIELWFTVSVVAQSAPGAGTGLTIGPLMENAIGLFYPADNNGLAKFVAADLFLKATAAEQPFYSSITFFGLCPSFNGCNGKLGFVNTTASILSIVVTARERKIVGR